MNNFKNIFKNKIFLTVFLSLIVFGIVFSISDKLFYLDKEITYKFINYKNNITKFDVSKDIVVVHIDEKSFDKIWSFPFSREVYSKVIKNLQEKKVAITAFDIILSDNWPLKNIDIELAKAMKDAWNVVLWSPIFDDWVASVDAPIDIFVKNSLGFWFFNPIVDKNTNEVYSFYPELKLRNSKKRIFGTYNNFNIEILKNYFHIKSQNIDTNNNFLLWDDFKIPYSKFWKKEVLINYLPQSKFKQRLSISDIYLETENYNSFDFENKIVIIWATAQGLKDTFRTPNWIDFWIYIHWNIINTILSWNYLVYFNSILEWSLILLLIIIAIYFNFSRNNKLIIFSNISILSIFIFLPLLLIIWSNLILNHPASIVLAFILSVTFSNIAKYLIENKNKKKMLKALWEYISKDIANKILEWNDWVKLDWEKKNISIFFSDIAWFTTISEKMDATELVEFLREYLWDMSHLIMDERWFINKYEWDAIMALFWVFGYEQTSNYDNCKSALLQQEALKRLNAWWKEKYWETLSVRMWLHFGEAIIWNIGAVGRKMEFTALGDSVNLASRLEWVNKFYSTDICVSEDVYNDQKDNFEFRKLDKIKVKWKNKPITIYELLSFKNKLSKLQIWLRVWFEKALEFYFKWDFEEASKIFKKLWELWDKPSLVFSRRCLQLEIKYEINIPREWWDWIWEFNKK